MAKALKAFASLIELTTTAACVTCSNLLFENAAQEPDPDFCTMDMLIYFNGFAGEIAPKVVFSRNATLTQKQNAVRAVVNAILAANEPAAGTLNNANIQISGLPV